MTLSLFAPDPTPFRIECADAVTFLRSLEPGSVDLIVTDPAYESLEKHRAHGTTTRLDNWFEIFRNERFPELFAAAYRALKRNSHLYFMCDAETMFIAKPMGEAAGFKFWKPLVWDKLSIGMGYHYRARYEFVLFFEKGDRRIHDLGQPDVLGVPELDQGACPDGFEWRRVRDGYPTEKPVGLSELLIRQSTEPDDVVVDCFTGSGSVGEAALRLGRRFRGCDISQKAVDEASARLARVVAARGAAP